MGVFDLIDPGPCFLIVVRGRLELLLERTVALSPWVAAGAAITWVPGGPELLLLICSTSVRESPVEDSILFSLQRSRYHSKCSERLQRPLGSYR